MSESKQSAKKMQGKILPADSTHKSSVNNIVTIPSASHQQQTITNQTATNEEQFVGADNNIAYEEPIVIDEELIFSLNKTFITRIFIAFCVSGLLLFLSGILLGLHLSMSIPVDAKHQSVNNNLLSFTGQPVQLNNLTANIDNIDVDVSGVFESKDLLFDNVRSDNAASYCT